MDDRDAFREELTSTLRKASVAPFSVDFDKLKWVPNFDRTRWFLVLGIQKPANDELNRLLTACNTAAEHCGHPALYVGGMGDGPMEQDDTGTDPDTARPSKKTKYDSDQSRKLPSSQIVASPTSEKSSSAELDRTDRFHISIAWNLIPPEPAWIKLIQEMDIRSLLHSPELPFDAVKLRIGREVHNIRLGDKKGATRKGSGILGL